MPLTPETRLGTYEILGPLGAGGMAEVCRPKDLRLGREVAVKVLPSEVASSPDRLARFEREARTVAGLRSLPDSRPSLPPWSLPFRARVRSWAPYPTWPRSSYGVRPRMPGAISSPWERQFLWREAGADTRYESLIRRMGLAGKG